MDAQTSVVPLSVVRRTITLLLYNIDCLESKSEWLADVQTQAADCREAIAELRADIDAISKWLDEAAPDWKMYVPAADKEKIGA